MHPDADHLWRGPRWAPGPACWPAWACWGRSRSTPTCRPSRHRAAVAGATPVQMQQTLSAYLLGFAVMNLFHGALSDSFGRRPVVLAGVAVFTLASVGCALSRRSAQLVSSAACRACPPAPAWWCRAPSSATCSRPADAQRVMSQVTIFFGVAPAIAPLVGGWLFVHPAGTRSSGSWPAWACAVAGQLALAARDAARRQRQPFTPGNLLRGYWQLAGATRASCRWWWPAACPSTACSCTCCRRRPSWATHLQLAPTQFFWFFVCQHRRHHGRRLVQRAGWPGGSAARQIRLGFVIMLGWCRWSTWRSTRCWRPHVAWAPCCRWRCSPSAGR
jgi:DHA1 family bicyclomycin/chloramphenicol resistance-like MFS transporter